jgi:DNA polymerase III subunit delta
MTNQPTVKPVYVLYGTDAFLRDAQREEILSLAVGDADPQTALRVFDSDVELAEVLDELRTIPFLAPRRVVIVRDADGFVSAHRTQLETFLESAPSTSTLILMVNSWPSNTRLFKLVKRIGLATECNVPARGLERFLTQSATKRGKKIARDAAQLLAEWVGADLARLDGEMEKLALYVDPREVIDASDVAALVTATAGPASFALRNALTDGDSRAALKALGLMLTQRGEEFKVLGMIASQLRQALKGYQLQAAGRPPQDALNPRTPYQAKNAFVAMLARRSPARVREDFRRLIRTDLGMKSGLDAASALQELVISLCE